ncbi:hypothetical protein CCACVL1_02725 [Corchorus capsularis]|uniref:Aminotransferase-like plant mobile domain-containing protein n=1 Tax=Corchorus capsularis TaxID=210143 RepID=A0A1R3K6I7_COCAP|nr:hypothetical protein CCACVL1_02725 [Corchorus capsularis]
MVDRTGLQHLPSTMFQSIDPPLIFVFVERWQPDTNTFHMPYGEMTIMLHDVQHILGTTLFVDKSGNRIRLSALHELIIEGVTEVPAYSCGAATLTYLIAWIYEYFPCFRPPRGRSQPGRPRACIWSVRSVDRSEARLSTLRSCLDQFTASDVTWLPYGRTPGALLPWTCYIGFIQYRDVIEPYKPSRVLQQLGYVQIIILIPTKGHIGAFRSFLH